MTFQISRRGKEYLETARTLLRAAHNMTGRAVAGQLKALAEDYQRRKKMPSDVAMLPRGSVTSFLFLGYRLQSFKVGAEVLSQSWNDNRHFIESVGV
jgi:hypothetical protein